MISRRKVVLALGASAFAPRPSFAQQPPKVWRIGFLAVGLRSTPSNPEVNYDAFVQGMRELGYLEGKNLVIEWRFADGKYERLPSLAAELVRMKVDVIVTHSTPATQALQRATTSIPIVTAAVVDPVASRFAASLARPGGNVTGLSNIAIDLSGKQIELLKVMFPNLTRVAVLVNPDTSFHPTFVKSVQAAAQHAGMGTMSMNASNPEGIERAVAAMAGERAQAMIVAADGFFLGQGRHIAEQSVKYRVPSISPWRQHVTAGSLMSYGQDIPDYFRRAATYVDKILKGAKVGELPFEQPTRIHLAINRRTAKALGITIPKELLVRADEVID